MCLSNKHGFCLLIKCKVPVPLGSRASGHNSGPLNSSSWFLFSLKGLWLSEGILSLYEDSDHLPLFIMTWPSTVLPGMDYCRVCPASQFQTSLHPSLFFVSVEEATLGVYCFGLSSQGMHSSQICFIWFPVCPLFPLGAHVIRSE